MEHAVEMGLVFIMSIFTQYNEQLERQSFFVSSLIYWRERNQEVDFVLRQGGKVVPIEVKSGRNKGGALTGLKIFSEIFKTGYLLMSFLPHRRKLGCKSRAKWTTCHAQHMARV